MQIDSLGLPKYGTDDLMDLIYKGKLDMLFKVYTEDNEDTILIMDSIGNEKSFDSRVITLKNKLKNSNLNTS